MKEFPIKASFSESHLPCGLDVSDTVAVPTVKGSRLLKYGKHAYYFYNFPKRKVVTVEIQHKHIIAPGLPSLFSSLNMKISLWNKAKLLCKRFHYGFSFPEQIMLMTVPHTVTSLGKGKFLLSLWSYVGYLEIDCVRKTVRYLSYEGQNENEVLGSRQWARTENSDIYHASYSLSESMRKISDPHSPVKCRIHKTNRTSSETETIWSGVFSDYPHDVLVNKNGRYCVVCELGMFQDQNAQTIPSKVLIIDLISGKHWILSKFIVAAHAQFDPKEPDVIYFSQHNFKFRPASIPTLPRQATHSLDFLGPASVFKYQLTERGLVEQGEFTNPNMFRLTNFHVFRHRGEKLLAAMGYPNIIYLANANTMKFIRKIMIEAPNPPTRPVQSKQCSIGTFSPSSDGERLFIQTTRSFQIVDVASGDRVNAIPFVKTHTAANHMETCNDSEWQS